MGQKEPPLASKLIIRTHPKYKAGVLTWHMVVYQCPVAFPTQNERGKEWKWMLNIYDKMILNSPPLSLTWIICYVKENCMGHNFFPKCILRDLLGVAWIHNGHFRFITLSEWVIIALYKLNATNKYFLKEIKIDTRRNVKYHPQPAVKFYPCSPAFSLFHHFPYLY